MAVALILLFVFVAFYYKFFMHGWLEKIALAFLALGGSLNLFERYTNGCVLDYIKFFEISYLNIYDVFIAIGVILLAYSLWTKN